MLTDVSHAEWIIPNLVVVGGILLLPTYSFAIHHNEVPTGLGDYQPNPGLHKYRTTQVGINQHTFTVYNEAHSLSKLYIFTYFIQVSVWSGNSTTLIIFALKKLVTIG